MYKLCLLVAFLACARNGRRLKTFEQHVSSRDVKGQKLRKQIHSDGQAYRSGGGQLPKTMANPRKIVPILLTFFSPTAVFAPSSNASSSKTSIYDSFIFNPILSNSITAHDGPRVTTMDQTYVEEVLPEFGGPTVRAVVSVDWEGLDLLDYNLRALEYLHEVHPEVPLTHFLNAAYFTKSKVQAFHEWSPHQALRPIDEHGLRVNGLKSLVEFSGVQYRSEPNMLLSPEELEESVDYEDELRRLSESSELKNPSDYEEELRRLLEGSHFGNASQIQVLYYLSRDVGENTDIRAYSVEELRAIISNAKAVLGKQGLKVGKSFRAGGWLAGPNVLEAIQREGFLVDSSAIGFDKIIGEHTRGLSPVDQGWWRERPIVAMLRGLWPGITRESQPFLLETPVGEILEMPVTGGVADYVSVKDMVDHVDSAVQQLDSEDRFVHIGFHQESAARNIERVVAAITEIKRKHGHRVFFETLEVSAQRARSKQPVKDLEPKIEPHAMPNS